MALERWRRCVRDLPVRVRHRGVTAKEKVAMRARLRAGLQLFRRGVAYSRSLTHIGVRRTHPGVFKTLGLGLIAYVLLQARFDSAELPTGVQTPRLDRTINVSIC